ncbi:MAG TPA: DUF1440 domain-containing protein [Blastocatellia bacterium]|nr:DUF1440 domain-containing protein [Blastocatellia bacterium]
MRRCDGEDVLKGLAAGALSGLAAAWVMNQFQSWWSRLSHGTEESHGAQSLQKGSPRNGRRHTLHEEQEDDATERLASALAENFAGRVLTKGEKKSAGTAIHYAFGAATGGMYGAAAELMPGVTAAAGVPFGAFVWLAADEGVIPALGLSKSPTEYPPSIHAYSLASHLVYGATAEFARRAIREWL